jgi:RND superfamily putative drug exporter
MALPSTEGLASASARRPWLVVGIWAAMLIASLGVTAALLSGALTAEIEFTSNPESKRGATLLEDRLRGPEKDNEIVIVRSTGRTVDDPEFRAAVEDLHAKIIALGPGVIASGATYYQSGEPSLVSADKRTTVIPFVLAGDMQTAEDNIEELLAITESADGVDGFDVIVAGGASINEDFNRQSEKDLQTGEAFGVPLALGILVVVFGALVAALIPVILAAVSIVVALGLTAFLGQAFQLSFFVTNVMTMMGLAVGIDYSLFIVSRYREERARGLEKLAAIQAAGATASRAVLFSGLTVVLALTGMLIVPSTIFKSLAAGAIIVVIISVLVTLTLLPAIIGLLGDRVNSLRVPILGRALARNKYHDGEGGFWDRFTRLVMRYPAVALLAACSVLIAASVPLLDINTGSAGVATLPESAPTKEGFRILEDEFSFGLVTPAEVVISGDVDSSEVSGAVSRLRAQLTLDSMFQTPAALQTNEVGDVALLSVPVNGDPNSDETIAAVKRLRNEYIPTVFHGVDADVYVTGATASNIDYVDQTARYTPIVLAFVLGLSFILLTVVFRSLVVPLKAIVMNLLSVGASFGLLVLVFQKGFLNEVFGFQQVDIIEAWVPLWVFSILFGLSMDYHVFLLSRIRERFLQSGDNKESVAFGLRTTAGIIIGAALIMIGVFGGIAAGELVPLQQMGFGLAVAVLIDATIVRSVIVPAAMELLGDRNWYLPRVLNWLPEMRTEGAGGRKMEDGRWAEAGSEAG